MGTRVFVGLRAQTKLGERELTKLAQDAEQSVPCLIFFIFLVEDAEQVRPSRRARMSALGSTPPSTGGSLSGECAPIRVCALARDPSFGWGPCAQVGGMRFYAMI